MTTGAGATVNAAIALSLWAVYLVAVAIYRHWW